jgi:hypothetical protein
MFKATLYLSAAMALAFASASPAAAAKLRLPPPRAPEQSIYSPAAIAIELEKRGYRIESMKRQGTAYSIRAVGPHKNRVQLTVDGRSGEIVGLAVLEPAPNLLSVIAKAILGGTNARYVDDLHPFGIIIPDVYQSGWITITTWTAAPGSPRYVRAGASGRGYRYAVPYNTVRPGRGGRSRSTIPPSRMQKPVYDVYEANGTELETVSTEDTTIITEVTTEETTYSAEYSAMEESYLGGELAGQSFAEVSDYDAEDGDLSFADDASDGYDAEVDETDFAAFSDEVEEVGDVGDAADQAMEPDEEPAGLDPAADPDEAVDDPDDSEEGVDDVEEPDEHVDEPDDMSEDLDEPDDLGDEMDEPDDAGDDYADETDDDSGDYDDGGDDYGDDGGDEPELKL